jgi:ankyrin repeat protein
LLAKLHIDSLTTKNTVKAVREALKVLPKDLESTYDDAMRRIERQNDDDRDLAQRILTWIPNAKRPMSVAELREALAVETDTTSLDLDGLLDIEIIVSVCGGLIIVDQADGTVRLIHYTTQHYFDRVQSIRFPRAQVYITETCIRYLLFDVFANLPRITLGILKEHPFLEYAADFCLAHARGQPELLFRDEILAFLDRRFLQYSGHYWDFWLPAWLGREVVSKLETIARFNLCDIARYILEHKILRRDRARAAYVASDLGYLEMVQLLIQDSVDGQEPQGLYGDSMYVASAEGHEAIVRFLIERAGADPKSFWVFGENGSEDALYAASEKGYTEIVSLLIQGGASLNKRGGELGTALMAASHRGHEPVVQLFIQHGADVNAEDQNYFDRTALAAAAAEGREGVVQLLVKNGADVNFGQPLQSASRNGHERVAQFLIENGAEVDFGGDGDSAPFSALYLASRGGHEELARLLIERGAAVDTFCPLQIASDQGHIGVVKMLLQNGADVNMRGEYYAEVPTHLPTIWPYLPYVCHTVLQVASVRGQKEIAHYLLTVEPKSMRRGCEATRFMLHRTLGMMQSCGY